MGKMGNGIFGLLAFALEVIGSILGAAHADGATLVALMLLPLVGVLFPSEREAEEEDLTGTQGARDVGWRR